mmetsp:Transcript_7155/g.11613  ORF Transcript_7155/g.11613 Transcript_7155/m.11613 type:complete len:596 (+) Transcript_7155:39-1826(+)
MEGCGNISFGDPVAVEREDFCAKIPSSGSASERLQAILDADFKFQLCDNPEFATQAGFHDRDDLLQDLGPRDWEYRIEHNAKILQHLEKLNVDGETDLSKMQKLHAKLLISAATDESKAIELGCHCMPINSVGIGGVYENFLELMEWMKFETPEDFGKYLQRLMNFPKQAQGWQDLLAYGSGMRGMSASKSMMRKVPERMQELIDGDLAELRAPMEGKELDPELAQQLNDAIENCFRASIRGLNDFMSEFYGGRAREDAGISAVRNGAEIYELSLKYHTTTNKTAQEIHDLGLSEVARIESRFQKDVLDALSFKGSFQEFVAELKQNKEFFYTSEEDLLSGYRELVSRINKKLPAYFEKLPSIPLEVVPQRKGPAAYYFAGTPDGSRPGRFYVNTTRLHERPKYEMVALALHEGVPGHHLQGALALENKELPDFLRYIEDRRYEFCPARRPLYTGYLEGWALYCEKLGEEMGMYSTPYELFGRLSMEMMRAVRLVVDTGIHAKGWSVDKAVEYFEEKTGMARGEAEAECHRYAAWPGQACAYKVGQLAIEELRQRAEASLGDKFDLKAFHGLVLDAGPLPLHILGERVESWISGC